MPPPTDFPVSGTQFRDRPFIDRLADAIELSSDGNNEQGAAIRSSIMTSVFALECAANCLLWHVFKQKSGGIHASLERGLSTLDKFEISALQMDPKEKFDRGATPCQKAKDLIDRRNQFVHPKVRQIDMKPEFPNNPEIAVEFTPKIVPHQEDESVSGLPDDASTWTLDDSKMAVKIVVEFLDWFFIDVCKQTPHQTMRILFREHIFNDVDGVRNHSLLMLDPLAMAKLADAKRIWKIDFRFIDNQAWDLITRKK